MSVVTSLVAVVDGSVSYCPHSIFQMDHTVHLKISVGSSVLGWQPDSPFKFKM